MDKEFVFDVVLEPQDICNMTKELGILEDMCAGSKRAVVYGMRNTGKTSLIKSLLIPRFLAKNPKAISIYVDFMGVETLDDIARRLRSAFERGFLHSYPAKANAQQVLQSFKSLRPSLSMGADGVSLSVTTQSGTPPSLTDLFPELVHMASSIPFLFVFDEFQDISEVPQAEALFRGALQTLSHRTPVIIMGSKRHLLAKIFARPKAPFHNWGEDVEIEPIPYDEYTDYMNERFARFGLHIDQNVSRALQDRLLRNPEAINMACRSLIELLCGSKSEIDEADIEPAIRRIIERRGKRFEQYLTSFSPSEEKLLIELSRTPGVSALQGKEFTMRLDISSSSIKKAKKRLEDDAVIYSDNGRYFLADPLLAAYLAHFR